MRDVLVALLWVWFAVSVLVYGYRLFRRITEGPKAVRQARAAEAEGRAVGLGEREARRSGALPPLPDGPVQARLPRSLATDPASGGGPPAATSPAPSDPALRLPGPTPPVTSPEGDSPPRPVTAAPETTGAGAGEVAAEPQPAVPPPARPTVAEAIRGIDLPAGLVPAVDSEDPDVLAGYRVVFRTRSASARAVGAGLADELERLGYAVDDQPVEGDAAAAQGRRLQAVRDGIAVTAVVRPDEADPGLVTADVTT